MGSVNPREREAKEQVETESGHRPESTEACDVDHGRISGADHSESGADIEKVLETEQPPGQYVSAVDTWSTSLTLVYYPIYYGIPLQEIVHGPLSSIKNTPIRGVFDSLCFFCFLCRLFLGGLRRTERLFDILPVTMKLFGHLLYFYRVDRFDR